MEKNLPPQKPMAKIIPFQPLPANHGIEISKEEIENELAARKLNGLIEKWNELVEEVLGS